MAEPWVSVDDVAAHLGVRKDSVYRWIEQRGLPAQKIGKLWKLKLSEVEAWMRDGGRRGAPGPAPATAARRARGTPAAQARVATILVVDDDESLCATLSEFLADEGYGALRADDGAAALDLLRAPGAPRPDLILLDLSMPGMDGWRFREEQAADPELCSIPVVLVTADRRSDLGGADVLLKPLNLALLGETVRRRLGAP